MDKPPIEWRPSPNYGYPRGTSGRERQHVEAIVYHIGEGYEAGFDAVFLNGASSSAHYVVLKDGRIIQYVRDSDTAWGAGIIQKQELDLPWYPYEFGNMRNQGMIVNQRTLHIEHEGFSGELLTPEQFESTVQLSKYLVERYGVTLDRKHLVGHYQLDSVDRANDPGKGFPWDQLMYELNLYFNPVSSMPETPQNPEEVQNPDELKDILDALWGIGGKLEDLKSPYGEEQKGYVVRLKVMLGLQEA